MTAKLFEKAGVSFSEFQIVWSYLITSRLRQVVQYYNLRQN